MNIKQKVKNIMEEIGLDVSDIGNDDVDLSEYIVDSLMFINFVVEIENTFNVDLPDEYLDVDVLKSFNALCTLIEELIKEK